MAREQFKDADDILEHYAYHDAAPDKPYSAPLFHAILAHSFSTANLEVTAFDVGMADYICDTLLRGVRLRGINADYNAFVVTAKTMVGKTIKTPDGRSKLKVILRRPPRCVSLRVCVVCSVVLRKVLDRYHMLVYRHTTPVAVFSNCRAVGQHRSLVQMSMVLR